MNIKNVFLNFIIFIIISFQFISCGFKNVEDINYEWRITFEDNFDTFDTTKWITSFNNGNRTIWSNKELQWYKDENVKTENGKLKLKAVRESYYGKDFESEKQFEYTSGMISNAKSFSQVYGKWEMRVKFPFRKGFWPAFWLLSTQDPPLPEIDVFEYFGIYKNKISFAHHWGLDYPHPGDGLKENNPAPFYYVNGKEIEGNFSDKWMVWSFECFPNRMVWKLDDNIVYEANDGIPTSRLNMIANVAVLDRSENNYVVDNSATSYIMEIDYVRIYKMVPKNN